MKPEKEVGMRKIKTLNFILLLFAVLPQTLLWSTGSMDDTGAGGTMDNIKAENAETTPVILEMNGKEIKAVLNDTLTAREFAKLLPYSVTVSRAADDLCGSVSEDLPFDKSEGRKSWKIGEIGWFGGWFTILVDHEEKFSNMPGVMIIGRIDDEYIETVKAFKGRVEITVRKKLEK